MDTSPGMNATPVHAGQPISQRLRSVHTVGRVVLVSLTLIFVMVTGMAIWDAVATRNLLALFAALTALGCLSTLFVVLEVVRSLQRRLDIAEQGANQQETQRIKSEHEREAALAASHAKSAFLAAMSHELRTPLTGILGFSQLLMLQVQSLDNEQLVSDVEQIELAGKHLLSLVNDVLDLSKIEAGKMQINVAEFNVDHAVTDMVATIRPLIAKNGNQLQFTGIAGIETMYSDGTKVLQILLNLLSNAAKFTSNGSITLLVEQLNQNDGTWMRFAVSDTGIGISPDQLDQLFKPFVQANTATSSRYGGTGLGLALSYNLCALLGGHISAESTVGVGSRFVVMLPSSLAQQQSAPVLWREPMNEIVSQFKVSLDLGAPVALSMADDTRIPENNLSTYSSGRYD